MGLKTLLHFDPGSRVVAEAATADEAVAAHAAGQTDVTLLDLRMPGGGLEALRRIRRESPQARVLRRLRKLCSAGWFKPKDDEHTNMRGNHSPVLLIAKPADQSFPHQMDFLTPTGWSAPARP